MAERDSSGEGHAGVVGERWGKMIFEPQRSVVDFLSALFCSLCSIIQERAAVAARLRKKMEAKGAVALFQNGRCSKIVYKIPSKVVSSIPHKEKHPYIYIYFFFVFLNIYNT